MNTPTLSNNKVNWLLFFVVVFLVYINFFASLTTLPQYALELGGTEFDAGLQTTLFFLAAIILRFYFGPMADNKGRKIPVMIGVFAFATAPIFFLISNSLWMLAMARIYQSIGLAAFFSVGSTIVADMAPAGKTGTYLGGYRIASIASLLIGPVTAESIIKSSGFEGWFITSLIIGFIAMAVVMLVKTPSPTNSSSGDSNSSSLEKVLSILKNRKLWVVYMALALTAACYGAIMTFGAIYITQITEVKNPGVYFLYFGLAGITANLSTGYLSDKVGRPMVVWPSLLILGLGAILLYLLPQASVILLISSILAGFGFSGGLLALNAWIVELAHEKARATAVSLLESTLDLGIAFSSLAIGFISGFLSLAAAFVMIGLAVLLPAASFLIREIYGSKKDIRSVSR